MNSTVANVRVGLFAAIRYTACSELAVPARPQAQAVGDK